MEQALLILLGGALTVVGGFFQHRWANDRQKEHWERERNEKRLLDAAASLAELENLLAKPYMMNLLKLPPTDSKEEIAKIGQELLETHAEWESLCDAIRRIGVVNRDLSEQVDLVLDKAREMFRLTARTYAYAQEPESDDYDDESEAAEECRLECIKLTRALEDRLAEVY